MKIEILEKKGNELWFIFEGSHEYANALRRVCMSEVPVLAVNEIEVIRNTSPMYDEMLGHRIGLVPITTGSKTTKKESIQLVIDKKGPGYVYSGDMKSKNPDIKPVFEKMPLTILEEGQELKMILNADLGIGKEHAKFSPCLFTFRRYPKVEILSQEKGLLDVCPKHVFFKDDSSRIMVNPANSKECNLCEICVEKYPDAVKVSGDDNRFICYMESWGQMAPEEILKQAKKIIVQKTKKIAKSL